MYVRKLNMEQAHIPNAINIGLRGKFATWAGTFVNVGTPLAIAAKTQDQVEEAFLRLARVGIESVKGYILMADFSGGTSSIEQVQVSELRSLAGNAEGVQFLDVRQPGEYGGGHAFGTRNLPLNTFSRVLDALNPEFPIFVICQTGYRSSLATSILENAGFHKLYNVVGGTSAWIEAGLETETSNASCAAS